MMSGMGQTPNRLDSSEISNPLVVVVLMHCVGGLVDLWPIPWNDQNVSAHDQCAFVTADKWKKVPFWWQTKNVLFCIVGGSDQNIERQKKLVGC